MTNKIYHTQLETTQPVKKHFRQLKGKYDTILAKKKTFFYFWKVLYKYLKSFIEFHIVKNYRSDTSVKVYFIGNLVETEKNDLNIINTIFEQLEQNFLEENYIEFLTLKNSLKDEFLWNEMQLIDDEYDTCNEKEDFYRRLEFEKDEVFKLFDYLNK